jgi:hypothetical protein
MCSSRTTPRWLIVAAQVLSGCGLDYSIIFAFNQREERVTIYVCSFKILIGCRITNKLLYFYTGAGKCVSIHSAMASQCSASEAGLAMECTSSGKKSSLVATFLDLSMW